LSRIGHGPRRADLAFERHSSKNGPYFFAEVKDEYRRKLLEVVAGLYV
jgi:hypothetical protein